MSRGDTAADLRRRLGEATAGLHPDDADPLELELGDHAVTHACQHQAHNVDEGYVETAARAAARIAIAALVDSAASGGLPVERTPAARIERVLDEPNVLSDRLAEWLSDLDPSGLGMVQQSAMGWMLDTLHIAARKGEPTWVDRPYHHKQKAGSLTLVIRSRCHATRSLSSDAGAQEFLYRTQRQPTATDAALARRVALLHGLNKGVVPAAVVLGFRTSLTQQRFDIDDTAVDRAMAEVAAQARTALDPESAERTPGPDCTYCLLQHECGPGMDYLRAQGSIG